ncbi:hypothetical protein DY000_02050103 [Brassica cretica]|uniref:Uncharacterized protein n=1 Tax=Brassica cretica TaxID=69181 RepID=A0ABQ7EVL1_BRACR|nr:hypothetical protein DY000_02050103 [Brassica cretica]
MDTCWALTKPRLFTSPRRICWCFSFSHRSVGAVGICLGGKLVSVGGLADRVLFDRRRRVSLAFLTTPHLFLHLSSATNCGVSLGGSISLSTAELDEAKGKAE